MDMEQGKRLAGLILAVILLQGKGPLGGLTAWRRAQGKKDLTKVKEQLLNSRKTQR